MRIHTPKQIAAENFPYDGTAPDTVTEERARCVAAILADRAQRDAPSMTLAMPRTVTPDEVVNLVEGTGALGMPWWVNVDRGVVGNSMGHTLQHWHADADGDDGRYVTTVVSDAEIVAAASRYLALTPDTNLDLSDNLGDADALHADNILQIAVYGSIIFG